MTRADGAIERVLASGLVRRVRLGLGGSHTVVTYPPLAALDAIDDAGTVEEALAPSPNLNLYLHLPYCEHVCRFCHYAKSYSAIDSSGGEMNAYLAALELELERRRPVIAASRVLSIYVGGGTPTVLPVARLERLLRRLSDMVAGQTPSLCVEVSPQTVLAADGLAKLERMIALGVDRFSIGVQSFSDRLLRLHRGHRQADAVAACERVLSTGIPTNIDLLQDLPGQTERDIELDCRWIERLKPAQLTWYILRAERGSAWYKPIRDGRLEGLPDDAASAWRRLLIFDRLERLGYRGQSGGRFLREAGALDRYKQVRSGLDQALLGIGLSSYSHGWGWFFRNLHVPSARAGSHAYVERLGLGLSPIAAGLRLSPDERAAAARLRALREHLPDEQLAGAGEEGGTLRRLLRELEGEGLVRQESGGWRLTGLGRAFEEEILSLFYSPEVRRTLAARDAYWPVGAARLERLLGLSSTTAAQEREYAPA